MIEIIDNIAKILLVITFFVNLFLAFLVLIKNSKRLINRAFSLVLFSVAFWNFTHVMIHTGIRYYLGETSVSVWGRLALVAAILIPASFLNFVLIFSIDRALFKRKNLLIFIPTIILLIFSATSYNIKYGSIESWGYNYKPGILYVWHSFYFILYVFLGIIILIRKFKTTQSRVIKYQIKYIIFGSMISASSGILVSSILPLFYTSRLAIYSVPFCVVFTASVSYVILRYRFLSIKLIIKRGLIYTFLLIIILGIVTFFVVLLGGFFQNLFQFSYIITATFCAFLIALFFQPLKSLLYKQLDKMYYQRRAAKDIRREVDKAIKKNADMPKLLKKIADIIKSDLLVNNLNFLVYNEDEKNKWYETGYKSVNQEVVKIFASEYFVSILKRENKIFVLEEIPLMKEGLESEEEIDHLSKIETKLKELNMALVMPLVSSDELVAIFFLGNKNNNKTYTTEDIQYLNDLTEAVAFCVGAVLLYKQSVERILR